VSKQLRYNLLTSYPDLSRAGIIRRKIEFIQTNRWATAWSDRQRSI